MAWGSHGDAELRTEGRHGGEEDEEDEEDEDGDEGEDEEGAEGEEGEGDEEGEEGAVEGSAGPRMKCRTSGRGLAVRPGHTVLKESRGFYLVSGR